MAFYAAEKIIFQHIISIFIVPLMIEAMGLKQAFFHFRKSELVRKIPLKIVKNRKYIDFRAP